MDTGSLVQPGRQLESFEKVEELAGTLEIPERPSMTAGYADIYCGLWITPQGERVEVAIKELRTPIPKDRQTEEGSLKTKVDMRLRREVFIWRQTRHPNLHTLLGYCSEPKPRLISPWCRHGNMSDYLQANPGLTRCDKLRLIYQAACGLEHLHSQIPPICHADIKPENVLINNSQEAALSNFGLSRVVHDLEAQSGFTTSETIKGTMRYMAGELFTGQKPNLASDIYAFGGLILTVMSGKSPFEGLPPHVILCRVVVQDEPPIPNHHPSLPAYDSLWKLMRRCWDKEPTARPTIREVMQLLEQIIQESNPQSRPDPASLSLTTNERWGAGIDARTADALGRPINGLTNTSDNEAVASASSPQPFKDSQPVQTSSLSRRQPRATLSFHPALPIPSGGPGGRPTFAAGVPSNLPPIPSGVVAGRIRLRDSSIPRRQSDNEPGSATFRRDRLDPTADDNDSTGDAVEGERPRKRIRADPGPTVLSTSATPNIARRDHDLVRFDDSPGGAHFLQRFAFPHNQPQYADTPPLPKYQNWRERQLQQREDEQRADSGPQMQSASSNGLVKIKNDQFRYYSTPEQLKQQHSPSTSPHLSSSHPQSQHGSTYPPPAFQTLAMQHGQLQQTRRGTIAGIVTTPNPRDEFAYQGRASYSGPSHSRRPSGDGPPSSGLSHPFLVGPPSAGGPLSAGGSGTHIIYPHSQQPRHTGPGPAVKPTINAQGQRM